MLDGSSKSSVGVCVYRKAALNVFHRKQVSGVFGASVPVASHND